MKITVASYITLLRIMLAPCIVVTIMQQSWGYVLFLFLLAMLTDFLDGFIARRYQQESELGQLLDPIADKLLIVSALYALSYNYADSIVQLGIMFLIGKECILLVGAAILQYKYRLFIRPSRLSRAASVAEMMLVVVFAGLSYTQYEIDHIILYGLVSFVCSLSIALLARYSKVIKQLNKRV